MRLEVSGFGRADLETGQREKPVASSQLAVVSKSKPAEWRKSIAENWELSTENRSLRLARRLLGSWVWIYHENLRNA